VNQWAHLQSFLHNRCLTGTKDSHARFHYNLQRKTMLRQQLESKRSVMGYKS
ncbi:unnamed protein product, partial [Musa acuminata var. zebrina]